MIRAATPADVAAVAELERSSLGDDAWSAGLLREGIQGVLPTIRYLVAERGGRVVGYAAASIVADIAELQRIAIDATQRRAGIGSELLGSIVGEAESAGAERLLLEVRETNAGALHFYAARGFEEIDRRARYYRDGGTAIVMQLPLPARRGGAVSP